MPDRTFLDAPSWPDRFVRPSDDPSDEAASPYALPAVRLPTAAKLTQVSWLAWLAVLVVLLSGAVVVIVEVVVLRRLAADW